MALDDISFNNQSCLTLTSTARPTLPPTTEEMSTLNPKTTEIPTTSCKYNQPCLLKIFNTLIKVAHFLFSYLATKLERFMIYSSAHNKCISIDGLSKVTARTCALASPNRMWKWTKYGQLQNIFTLGCLTAPDPPVDWGRVELAVCDKNDGLQMWSCSDDFVRLADTTLNLNFGNFQGGDYVVLFQGTGGWSKWKLFGKEKSICEKRKGIYDQNKSRCSKQCKGRWFDSSPGQAFPFSSFAVEPLRIASNVTYPVIESGNL